MADFVKTGGRQGGKGDDDCTILANTILVHEDHEHEDVQPLDDQQCSSIITGDRYFPPISTKAEATSGNVLGDGHDKPEMSDTARHLIQKATRKSTERKYDSIRRKWYSYCLKKGYDYKKADTTSIVNFIGEEYDRDLKYSTLKSYIPALQKYTKNIDLDVVNKVLKGIFNARPPTAKYTCIWDVNILLAYIGSMIVATDMDLSRKLSTLMMIISGNRVNMLSHLKVNNMYITDDECTFVFNDVLKHSRPNFKDGPLTFRVFPDQHMCPVHTLKQYLDLRLPRSSDTTLFITTTQPYRGVSSDTIARWIKTTMHDAGLNTGMYSAHSCRAASTSSAAFKGVSLATICKSASWSSDSTFRSFYMKEIKQHYETEKENFGLEVLKQYAGSV